MPHVGDVGEGREQKPSRERQGSGEGSRRHNRRAQEQVATVSQHTERIKPEESFDITQEPRQGNGRRDRYGIAGKGPKKKGPL